MHEERVPPLLETVFTYIVGLSMLIALVVGAVYVGYSVLTHQDCEGKARDAVIDSRKDPTPLTEDEYAVMLLECEIQALDSEDRWPR